MSSAVTTRSRRLRPGRPRHVPANSTIEPREQIIDSAARLFTSHGYAATSTRLIADEVGMRQASLYYHFPSGKEEILGELLSRTVRPTLDLLDKVDALAEMDGSAAALYALVMIDTGTLARAPHNAGRLESMPDVWTRPVWRSYKVCLDDLAEAYERHSHAIAGPLYLPRRMALTQVEGVVKWRAEGDQVSERARHAIAKAVLRACGADEDTITLAAACSWADLLEEQEPTAS